MSICLDNSYEYEVKELIKAFGIIDFDSIELNIKERDDSLFFSLNINNNTYTLIHKMDLEIDKKLSYKQGVYKIFSAALDTGLPWGILTGIRPVKLIQKLIDKSEKDIKKILLDRYYISEEKIEDMLEIAKVQNEIIQKEHLTDAIGIYIGIPFCPSRCSYCSFFSSDINKTKDKVKPYIDCLLKEIELVLPYIKENRISSIYFGGGTPSALDSDTIKYLLEEIDRMLDFSKIYEVCFEAGRPDTLDKAKLQAIKNAKVNRISINPQSMNDKTLKLIGRNHNSEDIKNAFKEARDVGFDNINMDIILGLEDETVDDIKSTMECLKLLGPESITVHTLAKKRASKLFEQKENMDANDISAQMKMARKYCEDMDLIPYYLYRQKNIKGNLENLGLSKADRVSVYNVGIMEEIQTIFAFGAGGMSKVCYPQENRLERVENVKSLEEYINRYEEMANRKIKEITK